MTIDVLTAARRLAPDLVRRLRTLVECETAPGDVPQLRRCADLLAGWGEAALGRPPRRVELGGLPHLLWAAPRQRVLILGHFDTVFPAGTVAERPFAVTTGPGGEIATGPGVLDMKGGIVQLLAALELARYTSGVGLLLTSDEETGSGSSRPLIEEQARRSGAVLVCEAATPEGHLKVARKGGSVYRLLVHGRAAHAGVEPHRGVNATVEVAHQVLALTRLGAAETSVTPTVLAAGTTTNSVPEHASVAVDVRAWTGAELERIDSAIRALAPRLPEAALRVDGGINRYPMPEHLAKPLLDVAGEVAAELGLGPLTGAYAPGASDGNFTAALGVPTLDGLGAVGGGAHARDEYLELNRLPERVALLAGLVDRLGAMPAP